MDSFKTRKRTEELGATPESVAATLRSRDPAKIERLMSEHRINAYFNSQSPERYEVHETTQSMSSMWRPGRKLGWLRPHRVRTFELKAPTPEPSEDIQTLLPTGPGRSVHATFVPMTKSQEWGGSLQNIDTALGNTETVRLGKGELGVTGELSGCSLLRLKNGTIGHLQPPWLKPDDTTRPTAGERAEKKLRKQSTVKSVFGPSEYGRVRNVPHDRTNAIMIGGGKKQPTTVISQSFFGAGSVRDDVKDEIHELRKITTTRSHL